MNILFANTQEFNPQIGGVERVSSILSQKFIEIGYSIYFVACLKSKFSKEYIPVAEQNILQNSAIFNCDENITELRKIIIDKNIDIIVNQAGNVIEFTKLCYNAKQDLNIPLITVIHIDPVYRLKLLKDFKLSKVYKKSFFKALRRLIIFPFRNYKILIIEKNNYKNIAQMSEKIILLSDYFKDDFQKLIGKKYGNKIISIANPFPFSKIVSTPNKEKVIIFVGRLDYGHKRPDRLIQIWEKIYKHYPDWKLKFVGDGPDKNILIDYITTRKIRNIEFLGSCNPIEYYKEAEIICMTSTIEGLPMALIEAVNFGCIPIAFESFKSINDIIKDGINGYIIKPYNLKAYSNKLCKLILNQELRAKMRRKTISSVDKFIVEKIVSEWINLFDSVVKK